MHLFWVAVLVFILVYIEIGKLMIVTLYLGEVFFVLVHYGLHENIFILYITTFSSQ